MTALAPYLSAFFREYLPRERGFCQNTCAAYAYAFQLLLSFGAKRHETSPSSLTLEQLDAPLVLDFLDELEHIRGNSASTRNVRLAAVKSFARFIEYKVPSAIDQVRRILVIPAKRTSVTLVPYLNRVELQSLLDAPSRNTIYGIRDRAMFHLAFAAGLRVSELIGVQLEDIQTHPYASVHVIGKGRRERVLPLWKETTAVIREWLGVREHTGAAELFLNARGGPLTRSGFEYILAKHVKTAVVHCPTIGTKRVSPHVLRHTCAMHTLQATHDIRKVALWLGHASVKSTEVYLRADPTQKLGALDAGLAPKLQPGNYSPTDRLLKMLRDI